MKTMMLAAVCLLMAGCGGGGYGDDESSDPPADKTPATAPGGASIEAPDTGVALASFEGRTVKVGCGMCIYEMPGVDSCELAIHADGHSMLVTGVDLDLHDYHLCSKEGSAVVSGKVEDGQLVATSVEVQ